MKSDESFRGIYPSKSDANKTSPITRALFSSPGAESDAESSSTSVRANNGPALSWTPQLEALLPTRRHFHLETETCVTCKECGYVSTQRSELFRELSLDLESEVAPNSTEISGERSLFPSLNSSQESLHLSQPYCLVIIVPQKF